ncbi:hypothetical protein ScPMuIL_011767 [Solemya velum]
MASLLNKDPFVYKQEKNDFIKELHRFHNNRGTPFDRIPNVVGREVDLYLLYRRVIALGGWRKVNDEERWEDILLELQFPKSCANAAHALKQIYIRFLDIYEKIHFHGEDLNRVGIDYDDSGPARKKVCAPLYGVANTYNYDQHKVSDAVRQSSGMSCKLVKFSEYDKLERALLSGLPNEVDFVINVCTLLSNESRHVLQLDKSHLLIDLLLGHVGIFQEGDGSVEQLYENGWRKFSKADFINFWYDTVEDETIRELISYTRTKPKRKQTGHEVLNLGRDVGVHDTEGQRIMQLAVIIRNLSFEEDNQKYLASNNLVFRFLLLCIYGSYSSLRQIALDILGNLSSQLFLDSMILRSRKLMMRLIQKCLSSSDKVDVVRGLEIISNLCQVDANDVVLAETLEDQQYQDIVKFLTVYDIQIIVQSLEALYQLSELGKETTTKIASVRSAVDLLVRLITVEAQSYGPNSLVGIKVVEFCPASSITAGSAGLPSVQALPATITTQSSPKITTASSAQASSSRQTSSIAATGGSDLESTTCNWLQAIFELKDNCSIAQLHMYADYINFCKKYSLSSVLPSHSFFNCVNVVFPKATVANLEKDGLKEVTYLGLSKRQAPLPFAITCAGSVGKRSVVQSSAFKRIPNIQSIDLTQTPTLRERLLAPPRVSQSSTSLPLGDNNQQPLTAVSNLPHEVSTHPAPSEGKTTGMSVHRKHNSSTTSQVSTSVTSSISVQIPGAAASQQQTQKSAKLATTVPTSVQSASTNQLVLSPDFSQNIQYQTVAADLQGTLGCSGTIANVQELNAMMSNQILVNAADTNLIKTLLAKKLRHNLAPSQGLRHIAPKPGTLGTNPGNLQLPQLQPKPQLQLQYYNANPIPQTFSSPPLTVYPPVEAPLVGNPPVATPYNMQQIYQTTVQPVTLPAPAIQSSQPPKATAVQSPQVQVPAPSTVGSSKSTSPKRRPSQGSRPSSPRASSPRSPRACELEVCGEVERAKDIVRSGTEAKIERVENSCLKKHLAKIQKDKISIPSNSIVEQSDSQNLNSSDESVLPNLSQEALVKNSHNLLTSELPQSDRALSENIRQENSTKNENPSLDNKISEEKNNSALCTSSSSIYEKNGSQSYHVSTEVSKVCVSQISNSSIIPSGDNANNVQPHSCTMDTSEGLCSSSGIPIDILDTNSQSSDTRSENITETICANIDMGSGNVLETICSSLGIQSEDDSEADCYPMDIATQQLSGTICAPLNVQTQNVPQMFGVVTGNIGQPIISSSNIVTSIVPSESIIVHSSSAVKQSQNIIQTNCESQVTNVYTGIIASTVPVSVPTVVSPWPVSNQLILKEKSRKDLTSTFEQISTSENSRQHANTMMETDLAACDLVPRTNEPMLNGNLGSPEYCHKEQIPSPLPPDSNSRIQFSKQMMNGLECDTTKMSGIYQQKDLHHKSTEQITKMNGIIRHIGNGDFVRTEELRIDNEEIDRLRRADTAKLDQEWGGMASVCVSQDKLDINSGLLSNGIESNMDMGSVNSQICSQSQLLTGTSDKLCVVSPHRTLSDPCKTVVSVLTDQGTLHDPAKTVLYTNTNTVTTVNLIVPVLTNSGEMTTHLVSQDLGATLSVQNKIPNTGKQISDAVIHKNVDNKLLLDNRLIQTKANELCVSRLVPTPDIVPRDSELSCDSVSSSTAESVSDKHSKSPLISPTAKPDSRKASKSSESGQSSRTKSGEKKAKKRSRNTTGSADSRASSTSSSHIVTELHCEWSSCKKCFDTAKAVYIHVFACHLKCDRDGVCKWGGCEPLKRKKWSLITHVQDHHCSEHALVSSAQRRQHSTQAGTPAPPVTVPALVYPNDAAMQAIRRFSARQPFPELMESREGPVTKHIRLTAALILRNLARYSAVGRSLIKRHEQHINYCAMSALESSNALSNCLWEVLHDH